MANFSLLSPILPIEIIQKWFKVFVRTVQNDVLDFGSSGFLCRGDVLNSVTYLQVHGAES